MKSLTAVCQTGASMPAINPNGRISRHPPHRGDGENAEMKMYLSKLKDLVPFMPKNRKLSKLEIIQHVIDYICDLQSELETHPEISNFDAAAALNFTAQLANADNDDEDDEDEDMYEGVQERLNGSVVQQQQLQQQQQQQQSSPAHQRQPLVDRQTPNTILPASQQQQQHHHHQQQQQLASRQMIATTVASSLSNNNNNNTLTSSSSAAVTSSVVATNLTHTLTDDKEKQSRQSC